MPKIRGAAIVSASGVGQVLVGGQQTPAIRVQVDPARLANMGMSLNIIFLLQALKAVQRSRKRFEK